MMSSTGHTNDNDRFVRAVDEAFFLLDRDQNRSIGPDDFCAVAKSIGFELDSAEASSLVRTAIGEQTDDPTNETKLTADQFAAIMLRHVGSEELIDELRLTFAAFDRDQDGRITRHDMDLVRTEFTLFDGFDDEQYASMVRELFLHGQNSTGGADEINFDQFVQFMMQQ